MAVDLTLAKQHLRVDHSDEDTLIAQYLAAAVAWVENFTGKLLTRREVTQEATCFGSYLPLFYGPNPESLSIAYTDTDDAPQTIADALIVRDRVYPAASWPSIAMNTAIEVTYTAGISDPPRNDDEARMLSSLTSAVLFYIQLQNDEWRSGIETADLERCINDLCRPYRSLRV